MPIQTVDIASTFVGHFKTGDNLVFNSRLICQLHEANSDGRFNKLIVIQAGSLIEAALDQIVYRAQNYNREGVPNISEEERLEIASKRIDKLNNIIAAMRKYGVLDGLGQDVYDQLHRLRKFRNKIHIQDRIDLEDVSPDEDVAFSDDVRNWALRLLMSVIQHLSNSLARPRHIDGYVQPLQMPVV